MPAEIAGKAQDRPVDPTAAHQAAVGGVDDGVDVLLDDVTARDRHVHAAGVAHHGRRRVGAWRMAASEALARLEQFALELPGAFADMPWEDDHVAKVGK